MASKTVANLTAVISANNTKFKKGISGAKSSLSSFEKSVTAIGPTIAAAFSVAAITNFAKESVTAAAEAEGIKRAFEALNDPNLLSELRTAVKGTVSDVRLMQSAVKANNFKIPLEQLAMFFKFAQKRAIETGESVDYLVESITNGIARKSLPILDNLGLSATQVRDEFNKTGDMAKAVANIISESMGDASDETITTSESIAQIQATFSNLKVDVGEAVIAFTDLNNALQRIAATLEQLDIKQASEDFREFLENYGKYGKALKAIASPIKGVVELNKLYLKGWQKLNEEVQDTPMVLEAVIVKAKDTTAALNENADAVENVTKAYSELSGIEDDLFPEDWMSEAFSDAVPAWDKIVESSAGASEKLQNTMIEVQEQTNELSDVMTVAFANIGSSFAQSIGEIAAGTADLKDVLDEIGGMILAAAGDIMIMAGLKMITTPQGVALVVGGLALKGIGSFTSAGGFTPSIGPQVDKYGTNRDSTSSIYGNDIRISNSAATNLYNRVG